MPLEFLASLNRWTDEHIASILSPFVPLHLSTTCSVVTIGIVCRRPLGSALRLAIRSRLRLLRLPECNRTSDVHFIRHRLETVSPYQYIVVKGPQGVGKTCIIETVTNRTCGVVEITVAAGKGSYEINVSANILTHIHLLFFLYCSTQDTRLTNAKIKIYYLLGRLCFYFGSSIGDSDLELVRQLSSQLHHVWSLMETAHTPWWTYLGRVYLRLCSNRSSRSATSCKMKL